MQPLFSLRKSHVLSLVFTKNTLNSVLHSSFDFLGVTAYKKGFKPKDAANLKKCLHLHLTKKPQYHC